MHDNRHRVKTKHDGEAYQLVARQWGSGLCTDSDKKRSEAAAVTRILCMACRKSALDRGCVPIRVRKKMRQRRPGHWVWPGNDGVDRVQLRSLVEGRLISRACVGGLLMIIKCAWARGCLVLVDQPLVLASRHGIPLTSPHYST